MKDSPSIKSSLSKKKSSEGFLNPRSSYESKDMKKKDFGSFADDKAQVQVHNRNQSEAANK